MKRIILTTGGTGGHIFPALAVAEELHKRYPKATILFMGGQYGQEADLAAKAGIDFVGLPVKGVMGRGLRGVFALVAMGRGILKALGIMRKVKPDLVVGFGGYAAFAGVVAAKLAGVPTAIHEQNSYPGLTNRVLGKYVTRIFLSMPDTMGVFTAEKTQIVGNPVRAAVAELYERSEPVSANTSASSKAGADAPAAKRPVRLLVMGGSLGARAINKGIVSILATLMEANVEVWHQTGQTDYEQTRAAYREAGAEHVRVEAFINDMRQAYQWADVVLCRAGGSSLAELTTAGLPAVLIPLPHAAQDHQRHNARFLENEGGAIILEEKDFLESTGTPEALAEPLVALLHDSERLTLMAQKSRAAAKPYATQELVDGLEGLARGAMYQHKPQANSEQ